MDDDHRALVSGSAQTDVESAELGLWTRVDRDPRAGRLVGRFGLDERLLINSTDPHPRPLGDQHYSSHALEPAVLQLAPARLGFDRNPVSLAFDRRADDRVCNDFSSVRLAVGALSALGDICRLSQFDNCSHE